MITFEAEEEEHLETDTGLQYATTLPSKIKGDKTSVEDIPLSELNEVQEQEVRDLLGPFSAMWPEDIGQIKEIEHHIDLVPDA